MRSKVGHAWPCKANSLLLNIFIEDLHTITCNYTYGYIVNHPKILCMFLQITLIDGCRFFVGMRAVKTPDGLKDPLASKFVQGTVSTSKRSLCTPYLHTVAQNEQSFVSASKDFVTNRIP